MKILHVLAQLPQKTGSGVYFSNLIESLTMDGIENACIYGTEEAYQINIKSDLSMPVLYNTKALPFPICGMSDEMPYNSTKYSDMTNAMTNALLNAFKENLVLMKETFNPDIILCHHLFLITNLARKIFPTKKVIGICHGTDIRQILKNPHYVDKLRDIKDLDLILTVNPAEHKEIKRIFQIEADKIKFVGGGYNEKLFYPNETPRMDTTIKIMYAGKITESKGIYELASALPLLEKNNTNIELHIVGKTEKHHRDRLMKSTNFSSNLYVYNAETQSIMADHMRDIDIFVLPSYYEALGLIAIEALACKKLVVTSEIKGLKYALGDKILESGAIEFTKLPKLFDIDKARADDIPNYVKRLTDNIEKQIKRIPKPIFNQEIMNEIHRLSWTMIGKRILSKIQAI